MSTDIQAILKANWSGTIIAKPTIIEYEEYQSFDQVSHGIILKETSKALNHSGYTNKKLDFLGGDLFELKLISYTKANLNLLLSEIEKLYDTFNTANGNTRYTNLRTEGEIGEIEENFGIFSMTMTIYCHKNKMNKY